MADRPRCCQQRPVPRTRREQGVPRCVRAPHIETISFGSVIVSVLIEESLAGDEVTGGDLDGSGAAFVVCNAAVLKGGADESRRSMMSGGGA